MRLLRLLVRWLAVLLSVLLLRIRLWALLLLRRIWLLTVRWRTATVLLRVRILGRSAIHRRIGVHPERPARTQEADKEQRRSEAVTAKCESTGSDVLMLW